MIEVEMKFRSPDNCRVEAALKSLGAEKLSEETVEDIYYSHHDRDFEKSDEALRLRKRGEVAELTYKGPRMPASTAKAREELTVTLEDALSARRILERLGYRELSSVIKHRTTYCLDALRVAVDSVDGLGQFVELEVLTEDVSRGESLLDAARGKLPLGDEVKITYLELLLGVRD